MKMIRNHPDEILKSTNEIWLMMVQMMFVLSQHKELHRKRYCRRYLIVKMVTLVRELLKYIKLDQVFEGILTVKKQIRFRAVKDLISDVFQDKHAEVDLCVSAASVSKNELKDTQDEFFTTKGDGLQFLYDRCELCRMHISTTSRQLMNTLSTGKEKDWSLIMFDCSKESDYNHCFHERCLKRHIKEELRKNKKASLKELDVLAVYRCVVCYKQS